MIRRDLEVIITNLQQYPYSNLVHVVTFNVAEHGRVGRCCSELRHRCAKEKKPREKRGFFFTCPWKIPQASWPFQFPLSMHRQLFRRRCSADRHSDRWLGKDLGSDRCFRSCCR
jgi:hypothetical protein